VTRFLLDQGAKVDAMGDSGRALLDAAKDNVEIAAIIRAAMTNRSRVDLPSPSR
jgi:hypothetical protein